VLTLVVTWPLARCLDRCLGEPPDTLITVYFLAWAAHALTTPGVRLIDATLFAPYPGTLALGDYMPGYTVISVPVIALTGNPVAANNVLLILSHTLAALGAAALTRHLLGTLGPALAAGVVFGFAPRLIDQAYNVQTLAVFWFPWILLALERAFERPTWPRAIAVAAAWLALALSSLNVFVYGSVLVAAFAVAAVACGGRRLDGTRLLRLGVAGAVAAAALALVLAPNWALAREWGLTRALAEVEQFSAGLRDHLDWPREHWLQRLRGFSGDPGHDRLVPGIVATVLAVAGLVAVLGDRLGLRRRLLPYAVLLAVTITLSLGPTLATPWGPLPLPYRGLFRLVPGFDSLRTPFRFLVFVDLSVAVLAAAGTAWWLARVRPAARRGLVAALIALILLESVTVPYPGAFPRLDPATVPDVYRWLARDPPPTLALGIPMGDWVNVAAAAFHLRPTANGWSSFDPPLFGALSRAMDAFPDARSLALARGLGTTVVLVDRAWLNPERLAALGAFPAVLRPERAFPTHLVFRLTPLARPAPEALEATAAVPAPGQVCVTLRNTGTAWVPLYPLHRLHLTAEPAGPPAGVRWLPLDVPPGGTAVNCLAWAGAPPSRIRGEVEAPGRRYAFAVALDGAPAPLVARGTR
jgi:hypothetical protein